MSSVPQACMQAGAGKKLGGHNQMAGHDYLGTYNSNRTGWERVSKAATADGPAWASACRGE